MKKLIDKIKNLRGETITEALVSVLIVALSAAMLASMIGAAVSINLKSKEATAKMLKQLTAIESGTSDISDPSAEQSPITMTINEQKITFNVTFLGEKNGLTAYTYKSSGEDIFDEIPGGDIFDD